MEFVLRNWLAPFEAEPAALSLLNRISPQAYQQGGG
jgi:hypothetical protein